MTASNKYARILLVIVPGLCLSAPALADDLEIPLTYEKCIGAINSAPIPELEKACEEAKKIATASGQPLAVKIDKARAAGEEIPWYQKKELDHWKLYTASAAFHQAKWNAVRLGIKNDDACAVVNNAKNLFLSVSKKPDVGSAFYKIGDETFVFDAACKKTPRNDDNDPLWGLSILAMKKLVAVYLQNPDKQDAIEQFAAVKFYPSWDRSTISNTYQPLRNDFSARYGLAEDGLSESEFKTLKRIYFGGLKALDKHTNDQVPDFIYSWLEG